jgi:hypothetical protein
MRRLTALAATLVLAAVPLAGCGSKAPGVPRGDASAMIRELRRIQVLSDDPKRCNDLVAAIQNLAARVRSLPASTDPDVRDTLANGVRNLADSARTQCQGTQTIPTVTTPTVTTQTVPPPTTQTTPPPTTQTTPPPTTQTTPPPTTPPTTTTPGTGTGGGTGGTGPGNNGRGNGNGFGNGGGGGQG